MSRTHDLEGVRVLVTRPAHQAQRLCELIEAAGGRAERLPALAIAPPRDSAATAAVAARLHQYDLAIFVSPNAVEQGLRRLLAAGAPWPAATALAAVGKGTADALAAATGRPVLRPAQRFDSEGLLARPELQAVEGQRVLIVRGEGGRELLASALRSRGARVDYAEVYRRVCPEQRPQEACEQVRRSDVVTVSSAEGLGNLVTLTGPVCRSQLLAKPLVVIGPRGEARAAELGFTGTVMVAASAADGAVVAALRDWNRTRRHTAGELGHE